MNKRFVISCLVHPKGIIGPEKYFIYFCENLIYNRLEPYKPYDKDFRAKSAALKRRNKVPFALLRLLSKPKYQD